MLLRAIADQPQPLNAFELARLCGLNRTTAWRILVTLEHNELVERDPVTQRYRIGYGLTRIASGADHGPLIRIARPILAELATGVGEQVSLGVPHHFGCTYIDHVQPAGGATVPRWIGQSGPLHATASGKTFLAALPVAERDALLPARLERFTDTTITSRATLVRALETIARRGLLDVRRRALRAHERGLRRRPRPPRPAAGDRRRLGAGAAAAAAPGCASSDPSCAVRPTPSRLGSVPATSD